MIYYDDYYDDAYYDDYYDDYGDYYDDYGDYDDFEDYVGGDEFASEDIEASYRISGNTLEGDPTESHQQLWDAFVRIIPEEYLSYFSVFEVFSDPEVSGYVYVDDRDSTQFALGLNIDELSMPRELNYTIIHEFAHVLTLNTTQVDGTFAFGGGGTCSTLSLEEGCTDDDSYINLFNEQFWSDGEGSDGFVSDYASTNVAEDVAESFTAFILRARPTGDSIADQKINFFYQFPEMIQLRNQIRSNLDNS